MVEISKELKVLSQIWLEMLNLKRILIFLHLMSNKQKTERAKRINLLIKPKEAERNLGQTLMKRKNKLLKKLKIDRAILKNL